MGGLDLLAGLCNVIRGIHACEDEIMAIQEARLGLQLRGKALASRKAEIQRYAANEPSKYDFMKVTLTGKGTDGAGYTLEYGKNDFDVDSNGQMTLNFSKTYQGESLASAGYASVQGGNKIRLKQKGTLNNQYGSTNYTKNSSGEQYATQVNVVDLKQYVLQTKLTTKEKDPETGEFKEVSYDGPGTDNPKTIDEFKSALADGRLYQRGAVGTNGAEATALDKNAFGDANNLISLDEAKKYNKLVATEDGYTISGFVNGAGACTILSNSPIPGCQGERISLAEGSSMLDESGYYIETPQGYMTVADAKKAGIEVDPGTIVYVEDPSGSIRDVAGGGSGQLSVNGKPLLSYDDVKDTSVFANMKQGIMNYLGGTTTDTVDDNFIAEHCQFVSDGNGGYRVVMNYDPSQGRANIFDFTDNADYQVLTQAKTTSDYTGYKFDSTGNLSSVTLEDGTTINLQYQNVLDEAAYNKAEAEYKQQKAKNDIELAQIEAEEAEISGSECELECRLEVLNTMRKALTTMYDGVKQALDEDVKRSFKTFG